MKQRKVEDEVATALASLEDLADPDYQPETLDATPTAKVGRGLCFGQ